MSASIAFFSFPSSVLLPHCIFPVLFFRWCDNWTWQAQKACNLIFGQTAANLRLGKFSYIYQDRQIIIQLKKDRYYIIKTHRGQRRTLTARLGWLWVPAYNGAETCEFIGLNTLSLTAPRFKDQTSIYQSEKFHAGLWSNCHMSNT